MLNLLKSMWHQWKRMVHKINAVVGLVLMSIAYWTTIMPLTLFFLLFKRDAYDRGAGKPDAKTNWQEVRLGRQDIHRAQRPW